MSCFAVASWALIPVTLSPRCLAYRPTMACSAAGAMPFSCAIWRASASSVSSHSTPPASSGLAMSYFSGASGRPKIAAFARIQSGRDWH